MLNSGERQVAPTLDGIRADHRARYEFVAKYLRPGSFVLDYGCGVGYGAYILAQAGMRVVAVDCDEETIEYAREQFGHENILYRCADEMRANLAYWSGDTPLNSGSIVFEAAVCFEVIEHVEDPRPLLKAFREHALHLYASVPNEQVFPFKCAENGFQGWAFHHRHYTPAEFRELLAETGWHGRDWYTQAGRESPVEPGLNGRTIIGVATPAAESRPRYAVGSSEPVLHERLPSSAPNFDVFAAPDEGTLHLEVGPAWGREDAGSQTAELIRETYAEAPVGNAEKSGVSGIGHVVILGLGPSLEQYVDLTKRLGSRHAFADQVWAINALGDVLQCDLIFHMDDVRVQEMRAAALPDSNIAQMVAWLKKHPGPVITSRAHPSYPGLTEFPLQDVINNLGYAYFNGTAAYACAYAIHLGAEKISFFGCDYSYRNAHHAEQGRACLEFWIGFAAARGIKLGMADRTSLLDTCDGPKDPDRINVYGYDFDDVLVKVTDGAAAISFRPKEKPPTAAEIEARYDHSRHPSPLLRGPS